MSKVKYIQAIVAQLENRFPDVGNLNAFSIFDPQKALSISHSTEDEVAAYGLNKVEYLKSAYEGDVEAAKCISEWEGLKRLFVNNVSHMSMRQMTNLLCTDPSLQDMNPQFSKLASIAALFPVSTTDCEHSFLTMNRVKTKLRKQFNSYKHGRSPSTSIQF